MATTASDRMAARNLRRRRLVAAGRCCQCGAPRCEFESMCDECARKHRERQRGSGGATRALGADDAMEPI